MAPSRTFALAVFVAASLSANAQLLAKSPNEPMGKKIPHTREMHGDTFVDNYFWYREKSNPELLAHLRRENAYADAVMAKTKPLQDKLFKEFVGRLKETDLSLPVYDAGYWYYGRTVKGKQYRIYCRRKGSMQAKEQILLDMNVLAKGKAYLGLGGFEVSPNGRLLAFSLDENGHRDYILYFKDLLANKVIRGSFGVVSGFEWAQDNRTLYYTTENASKRTNKVWRRRLGSTEKAMLYEETDPMWDLDIGASLDRKILFVHSGSKDSSEARFIDLRVPNAPLKLIDARRKDIRYYPEFHRGILYIRTNEKAREFKVVKTTLANPGHRNWNPFIGEPSNGSLDSIDFFGRYAVISSTQNAGRKLDVLDLESGRRRSFPFAEKNYVAFLSNNRDPEASKVRVSFSSMITPETVYEVDLKSFAKKVLKKQEVIGYDSDKYTTEQVWATARDGTRVPISLAYRKGTKKGRSTPLTIDAYGAYGAPNFPQFSPSSVSLMDRGFIVGIAHVRGGGDMGERWYYDGKLAKKMNTFTDVIDCIDHLVGKGFTSHRRVAISGGSAGGLTMGAVLNLRPNVCQVALVYVPFVDVINTMSDETIPLTTQEFIEWGNPKIPDQYKHMMEYSPYENIKAQPYPAILVRTSLNDSQVPYWEPAKWVSRLRDFRTNKEPLIFKTNMNAGHGGASGRYDDMKDQAYDYAFLLAALGITK